MSRACRQERVLCSVRWRSLPLPVLVCRRPRGSRGACSRLGLVFRLVQVEGVGEERGNIHPLGCVVSLSVGCEKNEGARAEKLQFIYHKGSMGNLDHKLS